MLDFDVSVVFRDPTKPESPSSNYVLFPSALLRIYVDRQLKLLVTNWRTEVSRVWPLEATDCSDPQSSVKLRRDMSRMLPSGYWATMLIEMTKWLRLRIS